jgi:hypothetical protein
MCNRSSLVLGALQGDDGLNDDGTVNLVDKQLGDERGAEYGMLAAIGNFPPIEPNSPRAVC